VDLTPRDGVQRVRVDLGTTPGTYGIDTLELWCELERVSFLTQRQDVLRVQNGRVLRGPMGLRLDADNADLQLRFLAPDAVSEHPHILRLDMTSPRDDKAVLFFEGGGDGSGPSEMLAFKVQAGRHVTHVEIPPSLLQGKWRLDPGRAKARYVIHDLELRVATTGD